MFQYFQIIFIIILVINIIAKIQKKNITYGRKDIFNFTVMPSLTDNENNLLSFGCGQGTDGLQA
jgi:hypothetical protein